MLTLRIVYCWHNMHNNVFLKNELALYTCYTCFVSLSSMSHYSPSVVAEDCRSYWLWIKAAARYCITSNFIFVQIRKHVQAIPRNFMCEIGFADIGYIGRYLISADTDMPTLVASQMSGKQSRIFGNMVSPSKCEFDSDHTSSLENKLKIIGDNSQDPIKCLIQVKSNAPLYKGKQIKLTNMAESLNALVM